MTFDRRTHLRREREKKYAENIAQPKGVKLPSYDAMEKYLEDPETLNEEAVFNGISWTEISSFAITMPSDNDKSNQTDEIKKFLEFLIPLTEFDFYDIRNSSICYPNAKIDFIIVRKDGIIYEQILVTVIEEKSTTSHKDAVCQVCDRYMGILKQQRQFKVAHRPFTLQNWTLAPNGTPGEKGYSLLVRLLKSPSACLGFIPCLIPNSPYLFTRMDKMCE
ncbi:9739_t:CDS:2 [Ambispora leptoticha]|uniref:9739_t:CDS:1 n=1 Tax=Ambispora leptoticha TaxID=144679 RepID=A0A9N9G222_9GLOM|nr:9739_t:CDS:2 [Ambispora leptoticha]